MAEHTPVEVDQQELERAQDMWDGFTKIGKYTTIATCACVALLAIGFYVLVRAG